MNKETSWQTDIEAFEDRACEILEDFLLSLSDGYTIDLTEGEEGDEWDTFRSEGFSFVYTQQGSRLARAMIRRLYKVANKYFPGNLVEIKSHLFKEL